MLLVVYNPLSIKTYHYVRIPAIALHYTIKDHNDDEVEYQLVPLPAAVLNLPGRNSLAIQELCFEAENIPPLGYLSFYISPIRDQLEENAFAKKQANPETEQELVPHISNEYLKVAVDQTSGLLESIQHVDGVKVQVSQNFYYYRQSQQALQSGAYSFRPETSRPSPATEKVSYHVVRGTLVKEIRQKFNDWITQTIRLYRGEEFVEMEWVIGPVPVGTDLGKEVVTVFVTNITNNGEFYTDTNSRMLMRRTCWNESSSQQQKKPVAACYYPVTSRICIRSQNSSVEMCVLPDRTQGGVSYNEGEIELMVHRRLLTDDGFGLEESLNEEAYGAGLVVRGRHRIFFGNFRQEMEDQTFSERSSQAARRFLMEPWLFFTSGEKINRRKWQNMRNKRYTALRLHGLPRHINVLTLEPWKAGSVLLRLENTLEATVKTTKDNSDDYPSKSSHITVKLRKLFIQHHIRMVRETTLGANQWLEDARQMDWSTRYVYNGGDDGLQPEDLEYGDDKSGRQDKEQNHSSEEDKQSPQVTQHRYLHRTKQDKTRLRASKNRESINYGDYENRRKRSVNITENLIENLLNDTHKKVKNEDTFDNSTVTVEVARVTKYPTTKVECTTIIINKTTKFDRSTTKPKLSFLSSKMRSRLTDWSRNSKEVDASEEDFSSNMRKRSSRRKKGNRSAKRSRQIFSDAFIDDTDDGITKSIYEMYYKSKPRRTSFKPLLRSSEEITEEPRRKKKKKNKNRRYQEDVKSRKSRNKKRRVQTIDMPFFITDGGKRYKEMRKRKEMRDITDRERYRGYIERMEEDGSQEGGYTPVSKPEVSYIRTKKRKDALESDDYEGEVDNDDREDESEERNEKRRKKRTISKDEDPLPEPTSEPTEHAEDYVITLRPTQIRTFVIWFEDNKKPYTM